VRITAYIKTSTRRIHNGANKTSWAANGLPKVLKP
jgi:hypothetical protein